MRKLVLIMMIAFSAATVNSFATPQQDKGKAKPTEKKVTKCALTAGGASCCKKPNSRASLLNAKPVTTTVAKATPTKTTPAKTTATKTTPVKKAA